VNIINVMTFDIRLFCEVLCVVWNAAEINYHLSVTSAADALQTLCPCPLHYLALFLWYLLTRRAISTPVTRSYLWVLFYLYYCCI